MGRYRTENGSVVEVFETGEVNGTRFAWFEYVNEEQPPFKESWRDVKRYVGKNDWEPLD